MKKKLYRSRTEKVIGGVCGGLGNYLDVDPVIIRIVFVVIGLLHGFGIIIYILSWIIIPEEPYVFPNQPGKESETPPEVDPTAPPKASNDTGRIVAGVFLIALGFLFLSHRFLYFLNFRELLPFGLVLLGILLLVNSFKR
jgi:phage shock protein PspC (stress-responsive transcriptional regulator)